MDDEERDEILSYNELLDIVEAQYAEELDEENLYWKFKRIAAHEGPLSPKHPRYNGSAYNVLIEWEDGTSTYEPLDIVAKDDPVTCATYAKENGLLDTPGWKRFKRLASRKDKYIRMCKAAKRKSLREGDVYKFGVQIPRHVKQAKEIDAKNNNTFWQDAMDHELAQLHKFNTFHDLGVRRNKPDGYQMTKVHWVFDVKHDLRRRARLVTGGHLTNPPMDAVYSGVVSMRCFRIVTFLAELNGLKVKCGDVSNAYLESYSRERIVIIASPEFGELAGHMLQIVKALYGLVGSGRAYHDHFADKMRDMGFVPSKADPEIWMRDAGDIYEYVSIYTDDLCCAMRDPDAFFRSLEEDYKYKLKGTDQPEIRYHLGADFKRSPDGILCQSAQTYIERMLTNYKIMFGEEPHCANSPMEHTDHPEIDESRDCTDDERSRYQSLIGCLQWCITLGRFDICVCVMTMSRFRAAPKIGHLERLKRVYGYLKRTKKYSLRFRVEEPNMSEVDAIWKDFEWMHSVYGRPIEEVPLDAPEPKGKSLLTLTWCDANLYHDLITGRSVTGVLHFLNGTPVDWFSKRQNTVATATYSSEFVAARIAVDQVLDLRNTLRYLGVPIKTHAYLFGDNQSVVTSSTIPHSKLSKRHNAVSYHRVREAIASSAIRFFHCKSENNSADCLTKFLTWNKLHAILKPIFEQ